MKILWVFLAEVGTNRNLFKLDIVYSLKLNGKDYSVELVIALKDVQDGHQILEDKHTR